MSLLFEVFDYPPSSQYKFVLIRINHVGEVMIYSQLMQFLNNNTDIAADYLTQHFIYLRYGFELPTPHYIGGGI
jgi:hypothetical protein